LEQLVAGQVSALFDDASQSPIGDIGFVAYPVLPSETQMNPTAVDLDMAVAQYRQPIALVRPGVFAVADPKEGDLHQLDDSSQYALAR
jgi:hypothetical protein